MERRLKREEVMAIEPRDQRVETARALLGMPNQGEFGVD